MRTGRFQDTVRGQTVVEGFRRGARDWYHFAQHLSGTGWRLGVGATRAVAGKRQGWYPSRGKVEGKDPHMAKIGLYGMGNGGRDTASGGSRSGVARRGVMAGGRDGEICPQRGEFTGDIGDTEMARR